ncbi:cation/calcium exchanger 5-like [Phragmites australis]|uniref:cation/calcium exchanger 5-like n=1 Tax=Phragmites australis TaxID=29695 RepID=UPI002D78D946|nr:cation/calcium exchanger 5-like [Phragmites australis]
MASPAEETCSASSALANPPGLLDYAAIHSCLLRGDARLSLPLLALLLLLHFRLLAAAAGAHFSPAVSRLAAALRLSPSMAAVTLLAIGNGAPDAFASAAALGGAAGMPRAGLAAVLSAGAFVSAFVVGAVALIAAPFAVPPASFARDVFFYLLAASGLFYIYLSAEIFLWQAVGLVLFYAFFVGLVFYMDLGAERKAVSSGELEMANGIGRVAMDLPVTMEDRKQKDPTLCAALSKVTKVWEWPIAFVLKLTIPSTLPSEWNKVYICANICLCPLLLLYSFSSFIPLNTRIVFLLPQIRFPLWSVVLFASFCLALSHFLFEKEAPETENIASTLISFTMSVFWISTMAGELLNCLAAIGLVMNFPPAILGMTVLAWGNSVGDLVADMALTKAGQPTIAIAGCFAGPMFNMLVGLGTALVVQTARVYPKAYVLEFHVGIVVAFVFLLLSLMGTLLVVTWARFRVPRFWGYCLMGLYILFTIVSIAIASCSG